MNCEKGSLDNIVSTRNCIITHVCLVYINTFCNLLVKIIHSKASGQYHHAIPGNKQCHSVRER